MDLKTSLGISASGLRAQSLRMRVIARESGEPGLEWRTRGRQSHRRVASFRPISDRATGGLGVKVKAIENDKSDFVKAL